MGSRLPDCLVRPTAKLFPPAMRGRICLMLFLIGLLSLGLSGCSAKHLLNRDFRGFESVYAETSNREVLLNLARLENREPTYFFKIGQITSNYRLVASVTGNASYAVSSSNPTVGGPAGGGNHIMSYENDPIFTFIPVSDEANAKLLLNPVPPETFYMLYEQGWRVDQLFRLMVDRIEITWATKSGCRVQTIRNMPPPAYSAINQYEDDKAALSNYVSFLRTSAVVYTLQKHGYLMLRGKRTFKAYNDHAGLTTPPAAKDLIDASAKNAVWELDEKTNKWMLGEKILNPVFCLVPPIMSTEQTTGQGGAEAKEHVIDSTKGCNVVNSNDIATIKKRLLEDKSMAELKEGKTLDNVLHVLQGGFSIAEMTNNQEVTENQCAEAPAFSAMSSHLVMRSLIGLMAAAAQEQEPYDAIDQERALIAPSPDLPREMQESNESRPSFLKAVPSIERIPLLRLTSNTGDHERKQFATVSYRNKTYSIPDTSDKTVPENEYWDRDMFRLISELTSQVTVDISKFPLTEILQ